MNCEWVKNNATLLLYDELADDARHEMDMHLAKCKDCAEEVTALRGFHAAMTGLMPMAEPTPNLLAASRMRLQEKLESTEQIPSWRIALDVTRWFQQVRFAPALAGILLVVGFLSGSMTTFMAVKQNGGQSTTPDTANATITSIKGITQDPNSNTVQIQYDRAVPETASGSLNDPRIQQLLLFAARSNYNSGVRMDSVNLLTKRPEDEHVREALMLSLRYDRNPGVRLKALEGLKPFVDSDQRVRDAMLEALIRDSNPGVRTEAIRALRSRVADTSVRQALEVMANQDSNKFIRSESRRILAASADLQ
ncbi:MAG: HEAT repeat domain-containing protein [Acidobacteriales bacterium]|nr:HEAT repeat domain-containing protein [Terriglobales bacterium]